MSININVQDINGKKNLRALENLKIMGNDDVNIEITGIDVEGDMHVGNHISIDVEKTGREVDNSKQLKGKSSLINDTRDVLKGTISNIISGMIIPKL